MRRIYEPHEGVPAVLTGLTRDFEWMRTEPVETNQAIVLCELNWTAQAKQMQKELSVMTDPKHNDRIASLLRKARIVNPRFVLYKLIPWHRDPNIRKAMTLLDETLAGDDPLANIFAAELLLLIGKRSAEARKVLQDNLQSFDRWDSHLFERVIGALSHARQDSSWAIARILQFWPVTADTTKEAIVDALWTIRPPMEAVMDTLLGTVFENGSRLGSKLARFLASYGRIAAPAICNYLAENPASSHDKLAWMSLMKIGWAPNWAAPWLVHNIGLAPSLVSEKVVYTWFDDPRESLRTGLAHSDRRARLAAIEASALIAIQKAERLQSLHNAVCDLDEKVREAAWNAVYDIAVDAPELAADARKILSTAYHLEDQLRRTETLSFYGKERLGRVWDYLDRLQPAKPKELLLAMKEENIWIRRLAALRYWRRTNNPGPAIDSLVEVLLPQPKGARTWDPLEVDVAIRALGEMGPAASVVAPLLERSLPCGSSIPAGALACIDRPDHPAVHDILDAFDAERVFNSVGYILGVIETLGPKAKSLGPKIYRIFTNGIQLEASLSAAKALWAIEPRAELFWTTIVNDWLRTSLYKSDSYYLDGWTFQRLREIWPEFIDFAEEVAESDAALAATRLREACSHGSQIARVNAARLLWLIKPDVELIISTLTQIVNELETDSSIFSLSRWYSGYDFDCRYGRHNDCKPNARHYTVVAVAELIAIIGPSAKGAVLPLLKILASREYIHCIYALYALKSIGRDAKAALPDVIQAISTPWPETTECEADHVLIAMLRDAAMELACQLAGREDCLTALQRVGNNAYVWKHIRTAINGEPAENCGKILADIHQRYGDGGQSQPVGEST
jgi:hypothetical protein